MIQVIPVRRAYVSMSCDWPGCEERIDFPEEYDDILRNVSRLNGMYTLARRMDGEVVCPNHPRGAA